MVMRAYRETPNETWCPPPEAAWSLTAKRQTVAKLEELSHDLQCTCEPAVAGIPPFWRAPLTANVACAAADAYILCKERGNEGEAMMLAVATYFDQIKQFAASENLDPPEARTTLVGFRRHEE